MRKIASKIFQGYCVVVYEFVSLVVGYRATQRTFWPQSSNFFSEKVSYIFSKKSCSENIFYIFSKKLIFRKRNCLIFRTKAYTEPMAYSENTVKHLQWNVLQKQLPRALFSPQNFSLNDDKIIPPNGLVKTSNFSQSCGIEKYTKRLIRCKLCGS